MKPAKKMTALDAVPQLVAVLMELSVEDQQRAISAAMILLGNLAPHSSNSTKVNTVSTPAGSEEGVSAKAVPWLRKNLISREQLEHIFMIEDESIDVIAAAMPGKGKRQQTIQAYVICGLRSFLGSGDAAFSDKQARDLCVRIGCYDSPNHATYMKDFGNWISGSKVSGWRLTNPGLGEAARLVKQLTEHPST